MSEPIALDASDAKRDSGLVERSEIDTSEIEQWQVFQSIADTLAEMAAARRQRDNEFELGDEVNRVDEAIVQALHLRYCISPRSTTPTRRQLQEMAHAVAMLFDERCPFGTTDTVGNLVRKVAELGRQLKELRPESGDGA